MINSKTFILRTKTGGWLGQVVLTENGMFSSVTDWGNLSFTWSAIGGDDFRKFICDLDEHYFGIKLYTGMSYILNGKKCEQACLRFAANILPALKEILKTDLIDNPSW